MTRAVPRPARDTAGVSTKWLFAQLQVCERSSLRDVWARAYKIHRHKTRSTSDAVTDEDVAFDLAALFAWFFGLQVVYCSPPVTDLRRMLEDV